MVSSLTPDVCARLTQTALFGDVTPAELCTLLSQCDASIASFDKGQLIVPMGVTTDRMGIVLDGAALVHRTDALGCDTVLGRVGPGDVFAETYALCPQEPLTVQVVATLPTHIVFVSPWALTTHHPPLMARLLSLLAQKTLALSRRMAHTAPASIGGRVLTYLSDLAQMQKSDRVVVPFNRRELAAYLGVDRTALAHALRRLIDQGVLSVSGRVFVRLDTHPELRAKHGSTPHPKR